PRVAYALGRALGPAVVRNRVRRRLRAMLQQASSDSGLPPGTYLFGAQPAAATRSFTELQFDLQVILRRVRG
ncbi:MAG: ribonuclease P protein component, partial [Actinomycetota bacterium]|nr:ribonuclease P protein component [Actinomycetota bacterium]